jgi:hypothetical protein
VLLLLLLVSQMMLLFLSAQLQYMGPAFLMDLAVTAFNANLAMQRKVECRPETTEAKTKSMFEHYNLAYGVSIGCSWLGVVCGTLLWMGNNNSEDRMMWWGPDSTVNILGLPVSDWYVWMGLVTYCCLKEIPKAVVQGTIEPYVEQCIMDHKTPLDSKIHPQA